MSKRLAPWCGLSAADVFPLVLFGGIAVVLPRFESLSRGAPLVLVQEGQPRSALLLEESASDAVRRAARELQEHVERASGARLPILTPGKAAYQIPAGEGVSQNPNGLYERLAREHAFSPHPLSGSWRVMSFLYTHEVMQPAWEILDRARRRRR